MHSKKQQKYILIITLPFCCLHTPEGLFHIKLFTDTVVAYTFE